MEGAWSAIILSASKAPTDNHSLSPHPSERNWQAEQWVWSYLMQEVIVVCSDSRGCGAEQKSIEELFPPQNYRQHQQNFFLDIEQEFKDGAGTLATDLQKHGH